MKHAAPEIRVGLSIGNCLGFPARLVPTGQGDGLLACGYKLPCTNVHVALQEMCWCIVLAVVLIGIVETAWMETWTSGMASRGPPS